jgi:hypothetical protein
MILKEDFRLPQLMDGMNLKKAKSFNSGFGVARIRIASVVRGLEYYTGPVSKLNSP